MKICERRNIVRKFVCILIIIIIVLLPIFSVNAVEEDSKNASIDFELGEILVNAFDPEERKMIQNKDIYYWNAMDLEISDQPIVKVYCSSVFREWGDRPFTELISEAEKLLKDGTIIGCDYIIFNQKPIIIHYGYMGGQDYGRYVIDIPNILPTDTTLMIQKTIQSLSATTEILGQNCKINNIIAFCGDVMSEQFLYVDTDNGVFVKYFDYNNQGGVWYEEDDIREMIRSYLNELKSLPETTENLYGGVAQSPDNIEEREQSIADLPTESFETLNKTTTYIYIISIFSVVVLCSAVILLIFRKKIFVFKCRR